MSDTVSLPGSGYSPSPVPSEDFALSINTIISQDDGGNTGNLHYGSTSAKAGVSGDTNIFIVPSTDKGPVSVTAGHDYVGIADESSYADTLSGSDNLQFMIGNNANDVFNVGDNSSLDSAGGVSVAGGSGSNTVNVADVTTLTTSFGNGGNTVNLGTAADSNGGGGSTLYFEAGDTPGSDTVNAYGSNNYIEVDGYNPAGSATINLFGDSDTTGGSVDTISGSGSGGATVNVSGNNFVEFSSLDGLGADSVNVTSGTNVFELDDGVSMDAKGSFTVVNTNDTMGGLTGLMVTTGGGYASIMGAGGLGGTAGGLVYTGASGGDTVVAGSGAATLFGGSGTEYFTGGTGTVVFHQGSGADTFVAGAADDTFFGGASGSGDFVIQSSTAGGQSYVINAFNAGHDTIDLSGYTSSDIQTSTSTGGTGASEVTTVTLTGGTKITIHGSFNDSLFKY
jgi:hypothetical protein